ncbi:MAG: alanine--tRNA ligase [Coriobacteriia bacterium]
MNSDELREKYLQFFEGKGATRRPSSSLIPDDPSLLLTTAGMVQFKPAFLGVRDLGFTSATTCQKCVRTTDIDTVGHTGRHQTFFEMLGNFSFGDYFKSEACAWAYEFCVDVMGLDPDRLWFSIFEDDDEAASVWVDEVGVPADRLVRLGEKDNFWAAGPTGPCGPCSELYYDQGEDVGCGSPDCAPGCDCDRFLEFWNLVFMQYDRKEDGTLEPLPKKNIDTGMGLERMASILQGVHTNFETDILRQIVAVGEELAGVRLGDSEKTDVSLRILADHGRAVAFLIADGVLPSNEGRGYVLRRILRRALRHGRLLGIEDAFMTQLTGKTVGLMGHVYPELLEQSDLIERIVESEEERFSATLRQGMSYLEERLDALDGDVFPGEDAFVLHDTYGFPVELTAEILGEQGVTVDMDGFEVRMQQQRERARAAVSDEGWAAHGDLFADVVASVGGVEFVGYEKDDVQARVLAIAAGGALVEEAGEGAEVEVVLDVTPFYAEKGGQVGDTGELTSPGARVVVEDTVEPAPGTAVHRCRVESGVLRTGDTVTAAIDVMRRERIRRNHTATHLLHWALRLVLGEHVRQSGSLVGPDRFRFDFTHFEAMTPEQLEKVERMVNAKVMEDHRVLAYETSLASAKEAGVIALFGEKYGDFVRVLEIGNFSKELCGGTHVSRTSQIGFMKILSEGSVGANLRRIEAVTSFDALDHVMRLEKVLRDAAEALKSRPEEVAERVRSLLARLKESEKALEDAKRAFASGGVDELLAGAMDVGYPLVIARVHVADGKAMRELADLMRAKMGGGAVVLAAESDGKALLLAAGSEPAVAAGFDAGAVIKAIAPHVSGGGGGKPSMAQAGGSDPSGIDAALAAAEEFLRGKG